MAGPRDPFGIPVQTTTLYANQGADVDGLTDDARNALLRFVQSGAAPSLDIISGYRDPARNARVGGASRSQHLSGNAVDISLKGKTPQERDSIINHFLSDPAVNGFGVYGDSIHIDTRQGPRAYWGPSYGAESFGSVAPDLLPRVKEWASGAQAPKPAAQNRPVSMAKKLSEADIDGMLGGVSSAKAAPMLAEADIDAMLSDNGRMGFATPAQRGGGEASLRDVRREAYKGEALAVPTGDTFAQKLGSSAMATTRGVGQMIPFYNDIVAGTSTLLGSGQGGTFAERFRDNADRLSGQVSADRQQQPIASYGGSGVGLIATLPVGNAQLQAARGLGEATTATAGLSGMAGALYGASEGDTIGQRAANAVLGGVGGAAIGAAAPAVVNSLSAVGGAVGNALAPVAGLVRAARNPQAEAQARVGNALARDNADLANSLSGLQEAGAPAVVADAGGEYTRALARSAANNSPEARQIIAPAIEERFATQGDRIVDTLRKIGGGNAGRTIDDLRDAAQASNRAAYANAYANGEGVWSDQLRQLTAAPAVQDAIKSVLKTAANKTVAQGMPPVQRAFVETADGGIDLARRADGSVATPNVQFWDYLQRNLRGKAGEAARAGNNDLAGDYSTLRRQILAEVDEAVPAFRDARQGAARFFGAEDAYEAGQKFLSSKMENFEAQKSVSKMTREERDLFTEGFREQLIAKIREVPENRNLVINSMFNSPAARERIQIALGPKRAEQLQAALHVEDVMDKLRTAMGNSTTARQLVELGLGGAGGMFAFNGNWDAAALSIGAAAASRGKVFAEKNVAKEIARILSSQDPAALEGLIIKATKDPATLRSIQALSSRLSGLVSSSAAGMRPSEGFVLPRMSNQLSTTAEDQQQ